MNKAVFLDRDGTLIEHYDYITRPDQVQLLPRVAPGLRRLREKGYLLVIITNQSAVARGMITEKQLGEIHDRLVSLLAKDGAYLDKIYYCPYHPDAKVEKYRRDSELRKPEPGMFYRAAAELEIDLEQSWMIGDDDRDIQAGQAAGCRTIMLEDRGSSLVQRGGARPDFVAVNLQEAVNMVIRHRHNGESEAGETAPVDEKTEKVEEVGDILDEGDTAVVEDMPAGPESEPEPASNEEKDPAAVPEQEKTPETMRDEPVKKEDEIESPVEIEDVPLPEEVTAEKETVLPAEEETQMVSRTQEPEEKEASLPSLEQQVQSIPFINRRKTKRQAPESQTDDLLKQILRELKSLNRSQHAEKGEFSIGKLIAGILQMLVIACLIMALRAGMGAEPNYDAARNSLLLALTLQTMALTMLSIHK